MVSTKQEKVTVILPSDIKDEVVKLKDELKISMNQIYQIAIAEYVKKKNKEKLKAEAKQMLEEYKNNSELKELSDFEEDIVAY